MTSNDDFIHLVHGGHGMGEAYNGGWKSARLPVISLDTLMECQWKTENKSHQLPPLDLWSPYSIHYPPWEMMMSPVAPLATSAEWLSLDALPYQRQADKLSLPLLSPSVQDEDSVSSRSGSSYSGGSSPMRLPLSRSSSSEFETGYARGDGVRYYATPQGIIPIPVHLAALSVDPSSRRHVSWLDIEQRKSLQDVASLLQRQWHPGSNISRPMAPVIPDPRSATFVPGHSSSEAPKPFPRTQNGSSILKPLPGFTDDDNKQQVNSIYRKMIRTYRCKQCGYLAKSKDDYWSHSRVHIKVHKMLSCPKCLFVTEHKHHLEYHLRNHFGSKPFTCPKCPYSCVNNSMLKSHLKSHTNHCEYKCADCDYATKYCHSLKLHLKKRSHKAADPEVLNGFRKWSTASSASAATVDD